MRQRLRADRDFYRTPKECVLLADKLMDDSLSWWECCAGDGAISSNLSKITYSSDIYPMVDGIEKLNVLTCDKPKDIDAIITNPPFFAINKILDRALFEWKIPILLLCRIEPLSTKIRNHYTKFISDMYIVSDLIKFQTEDGRVVNGNGTMRCAWMLFSTEKQSYTKTKWVTYEKNNNFF